MILNYQNSELEWIELRQDSGGSYMVDYTEVLKWTKLQPKQYQYRAVTTSTKPLVGLRTIQFKIHNEIITIIIISKFEKDTGVKYFLWREGGRDHFPRCINFYLNPYMKTIQE